MAVECVHVRRAGDHRGTRRDHRLGPRPGRRAGGRSIAPRSATPTAPDSGPTGRGGSLEMTPLLACASPPLVHLPLFGGPVIMLVVAVILMTRAERRRATRRPDSLSESL